MASNYGTHSDKELMHLIANSNQGAFAELYERYWDKLFSVALHTLSSPEDAEEVVQDLFTKIWNIREKLVIEKEPGAYLAAAVKYQVISRLRIRKRRMALEKEQPIDLTALSEDSTTLYLREKEIMEELERGIQLLPQKCQLVFRLSREQGLSTQEIADELKISTNTVENHLTKALRILREYFKKSFFLFFL
ncbi:RNA polymerase sigma-70 factor, ECF subfamily [bacterium A37T11]|nr:RNA polymerase sigma-70 factor, ECF subfamily [bacterium A37T11]